MTPRPIAQVLVTVITYRRPDSLEKLLISLGHVRTTVKWRLVVVDNDPAESARAVCELSDLHPQYIREPRPGIPAARNACLAAMEPDDDAIVFIDDDELVDVDWLEELVRATEHFGSDITAGPVLSVLPPETPKWIQRGAFFQRRVRQTGATDGIPATNNVLVRRSTLAKHPHIRFDDAFRLTGGSDTDFFSRLIASGASVVWTSNAIVREHVQVERLTLRWLTQRATRGGEVYTVLQTGKKTRLRLACEAGGLILAGILMMPASAIRPSLRGRNLVLLARGRGILRGLSGLSVNEYARHD